MNKNFKLVIASSYEDMSKKAFNELRNAISKGAHNIGLATGSTPIGLYQNIVKDYENGNKVYKNLTYYNLDEYHGLEKDHPQSYHYYMKNHLFNHIHATNFNIPAGDVEIEKCISDYQKILDNTTIDIQVLGIGHNGHIGFNEPNTPFDIKTNYVKLKNKTLEANKRFFDNNIDEVPKNAITMGIADIMRAKKILIIANGESKATAIYNMIYGEVTPLHPASVLQNHPDVTVVIDHAAASKLPLKTISIDISSTRLKIARYNKDMQSELLKIYDLNGSNPIKLLDEHIDEFIDENTYRIGSSISGHVFRGCVSNPKLGLYKFDLYNHLKNKYHLKTKVLNRSNAACYAEYAINHSDKKSAYYVSLATGVGGGYVFNNQIIEGLNGLAGEVCNMVVDGNFNPTENLGAFERDYSKYVSIDHQKLISNTAALLNNVIHTVDPDTIIIDIKNLEIDSSIVPKIAEETKKYLFSSLNNDIIIHEANVEHNSLLGMCLYLNRNA